MTHAVHIVKEVNWTFDLVSEREFCLLFHNHKTLLLTVLTAFCMHELWYHPITSRKLLMSQNEFTVTAVLYGFFRGTPPIYSVSQETLHACDHVGGHWILWRWKRLATSQQEVLLLTTFQIPTHVVVHWIFLKRRHHANWRLFAQDETISRSMWFEIRWSYTSETFK